MKRKLPSLIGNQHGKRFNKFSNLSNGTTIVELTQGQWTIVSKDSWERIKHHKWTASWDPRSDGFYVTAKIPTSTGQKTIYIHETIKPYSKGFVTDHINRDTLNNTDENLQVITIGENRLKGIKCKMMKGHKPTSKYVGVSWYKNSRTWVSSITFNFIRYHLGYFENEIDAHKARQQAYDNYVTHRILPLKKGQHRSPNSGGRNSSTSSSTSSPSGNTGS
jgi:hypothetical protein